MTKLRNISDIGVIILCWERKHFTYSVIAGFIPATHCADTATPEFQFTMGPRNKSGDDKV